MLLTASPVRTLLAFLLPSVFAPKLFTLYYDGDTGQGDGGSLGDDPGNMDSPSDVSDEGIDGGWANNPSAQGPEDGRDFGDPDNSQGMSEQDFQDQQDQNNWAGYTNSSKGTPGAYGTLNNDDTLSGPGRGGASQAALDEYNALSAQGAFGWGNYSYTDLDNTSKTNWGGITHDVFGVLSNPIAQTIGNIVAPAAYNTVTGLLGLANSAIAGRGYANSASALGQTIGSLTGLGGLAGKAAGGVIGNALDGNTKGAISAGLNGALAGAGVSLGKETAQAVGQQVAGHVTGPTSAAIGMGLTAAAGKAGQSAQNAAVDSFSSALAENMANPTGGNNTVAANDGDGLGGGGSSGGATDSTVSVAENTSTPGVSSGLGVTASRTSGAPQFFSGGWGSEEDSTNAAAKKIAQALAARKEEQQMAMGLA